MPFKPVGIDEDSNFPLRVRTAQDARVLEMLTGTLVEGANVSMDYNATTKKLTISSTGGGGSFDGVITIADVVDLQETLDSIVAGDVPAATITTAGISRFPTVAERNAGTATNLAMTPADVQAKINGHTNALDPHVTYSEAIDALQGGLGLKVDSPVPVEEISGVSANSQANTLAQRTATGALSVADAILDGEAVNLKQARSLAAFTPGADVRDLEATGLPLTLSTAATTWTTLPGILVPDAASGHRWECELSIKYQAEAATGFKIRHKAGVVSATNFLSNFNPSFESLDMSAWSVSGNATFTRATAGGGFDGAAYGVLTATGTGNLTLTSPWMPIESVTAFSAGIYARLGAGTARTVRTDLQYATDANGTGQTTDLGAGTGIITASSVWQRSTKGDSTASTPGIGATHVKIRVVYPQATIGDSVHLDAVQVEAGSPLPAYGSTGGSGASALAVTGDYRGLILTNPTVESYSRRTTIRSPAVANIVGEAGGLGTTTDADLTASLRFTVTGTGLTNQRIEFEAAPRSTATVAPKIVAATATFARVF